MFPVVRSDEKLLDLILQGDDLALELRRLVGGDRARNHGARHAARASEGHLRHEKTRKAARVL